LYSLFPEFLKFGSLPSSVGIDSPELFTKPVDPDRKMKNLGLEADEVILKN